MRILSLDYGEKTIGVAVTDALGWTAQGVETIFRERENGLRASFRRIGELIQQYGVEKIIVGCPVNMDGTSGERAAASEAFAQKLRARTGLPVFLWDERLTTREAREILSAQGVSGKEQKRYVDKIAAVLILEDYMRSSENKDE